MKIKAHAKINLGLDVLRRRDDGYHEVRMVMQTIGLCDELSFERTGQGIRIVSDSDAVPLNEDNLIYKAASLMMEEYGIKDGIEVRLEKNIPVAAGLAGGSTDAAAVFKAMNMIFGLGLDTTELQKLGVRIGADIPYCIMGGTATAEGIGEKLTPIKPCPKCRVLLAKPEAGVSTAHVYRSLKLDEITHPDIDAVISGIESGSIKDVAANLGNVLESVTVPENPVIDKIKKIMTENGAMNALMSGSGPSVFGLFENEEDIKRAYGILNESGYAPQLFITEIFNDEQ
ncbi:MAG: 4-(cytidine 5'-diphospho)-2-C-methyl-D-erythritol kinase [Lachnospiraceae bacterium]|nr:4-(cytidine 5'-diphospho)-2-C-methyl-D-erythritol kinase [Lachnospiraceae bacterium]